jgi:hypothetical protein
LRMFSESSSTIAIVVASASNAKETWQAQDTQA